MKRKIRGVLTMFFVLCTVVAIGGCGNDTAQQIPEQEVASVITEPAPTAPPEYITFNGESIRLQDYASLVSLFEQFSYEDVIVEDEDDFIDAAEEYDLEHLSELYSYIDSLSVSEAGELHRIMLEALNNA